MEIEISRGPTMIVTGESDCRSRGLREMLLDLIGGAEGDDLLRRSAVRALRAELSRCGGDIRLTCERLGILVTDFYAFAHSLRAEEALLGYRPAARGPRAAP